MRLGDPAFTSFLNSPSFDQGSTPSYPVYFDEYDIGGSLLSSFALPAVATSPTQPACTLGKGLGAWLYDSDGLASNSVDMTIALIPCYNTNAGDEVSLDTTKVIATLDSFGETALSAPIDATYLSPFANAGIRQVATVNGSGFWIAGTASDEWGFRYVADMASTTSSFVSGYNSNEPGYYDARGVTIFNGQLYATDSSLDPGWAAVFTMGTGLPLSEDHDPDALLPGFDGITPSPWTFVFQNESSLWVAVTDTAGVPGAVENYVYDPDAGAWESVLVVPFDYVNPVYSTTGRYENNAQTGFQTHYIVYGSSQSAWYRYDSVTDGAGPATLVAVPGDGQWFRAVALPPCGGQRSASPSPSQTRSASASASATASYSPSASPTAHFHSTSILIARLGDGSSASYGPDAALPVWWDEYDVITSVLYSSIPLPTSPSPGKPACTLGAGVASKPWWSRMSWNYHTDGLPSNSPDTGLAMLICFNITAGQNMTMMSSKTISMVDQHKVTSSTIALYPYIDVYNISGAHQATSVNGSSFYMAGASADYWGFRYAPSRTTRTTFFVQGGLGGVGTSDARAVTLFRGVLYGSSGPGDGGSIYRISSSNALPTSSGNDPIALPGLPLDLNPWTFFFENATSLWVSEIGPSGAAGLVSHFVFSVAQWSWESDVVFDALYPVYSITGRSEPSFGGFFVYACSQRAVYRMSVSSRAISVVTSTPPGQVFRGVALPPLLGGVSSATPSPSASPSSPARRRR